MILVRPVSLNYLNIYQFIVGSPIIQSSSDNFTMRVISFNGQGRSCRKALEAVRLSAGNGHFLLKLCERFVFIKNTPEPFEVRGLPPNEVL